MATLYSFRVREVRQAAPDAALKKAGTARQPA
jgi:hypothetical protein